MIKKEYDLILIDSGFSGQFDKSFTIDTYEYQGKNWSINAMNDEVGHGTSVLSVIVKNLHDQCACAVFKAFDINGTNNLLMVKNALKYIISNFDCKYIQMSFGIRGYDEELQNLCKKLYDNSVQIIAAYDNFGSMSYPAAFDFVIGVIGNPFLKNNDDFKLFYNNKIDIAAKMNEQHVISMKNNKKAQIKKGNSFAASYVTLKLLQSGIKFNNKEEALSYLGKEIYHLEQKKDQFLFQGERVAIFPLNKEMYSMINYADKLLVNLTDVYDIKYACNVGRTIKNFAGNKTYVVKNIQKCEWGNFDTFIIGHLQELSSLVQKDLKRDLLRKCIEHNKNVYCYDSFNVEEFKEEFRKHNIKIYYADDYDKTQLFGKLYQIKTPILLVLGTSKKQGKFTLQIQIKNILEEHEIKVGFLGTEPNAIFFNADETIPFGYDSILAQKSSQYIIETFNEKLHNIDVKNYDIILVGSQSGFLPKACFNSYYINSNQFPFLYGIMPDGIILTVSYDDSIDFIKKNIEVLESMMNTKILMLALYSYKNETENIINVSKEKLEKYEIEKFKNEVADKLKLPLIVSGDSNYNEILFNIIIKFFCEGTLCGT